MLEQSASVYRLFIVVGLSVGGVIAHNDRARTFRYRTCVFIAHFLSRTWLTLNSVSLFIMQMCETFILATDKRDISNFHLAEKMQVQPRKGLRITFLPFCYFN